MTPFTSRFIRQRKPAQKRALSRWIERTKGGLNAKLHAVCNASGQPVALHLTERQASDYKGAAILLDAMPEAKELLTDKGDDADWFRNRLLEKGITPCIPSRKNRKELVAYDKIFYKQRHKIGNVFGKLKDWRRIAMRY